MHNAPSLDMTQSDLPEENMIQTLTNMADKRLFKLVKWCKSLPLFKNILVITISDLFIVSLHTKIMIFSEFCRSTIKFLFSSMLGASF